LTRHRIVTDQLIIQVIMRWTRVKLKLLQYASTSNRQRCTLFLSATTTDPLFSTILEPVLFTTMDHLLPNCFCTSCSLRRSCGQRTASTAGCAYASGPSCGRPFCWSSSVEWTELRLFFRRRGCVSSRSRWQESCCSDYFCICC
jgi:hypothetical protein